MSDDLLKTIAPKSDQLNFDDFIGGETKTITITGVKIVNTDQPIELHSAEYPGRPFKPGLTCRRILIGIWGKSAVGWEGRSLTLYGDPEVKFGKQKVGGIRISHASHIDGTKTLMLTVTRAKKAPFVVQPLEVAPAVTAGEAEGWLRSARDMPGLQQAWAAVQKAGLASEADLVALKDDLKGALDDPGT